MKTITLILLTLFMAKGCSQQAKNDLATAEINYTANTRGFFQKISIKNQMVTVSKNRNGGDTPQAIKISDADWNELVGYFKVIPLDSLSTYKDPTQKRFYDGAPIANMVVIYKEKEYKTASFDHGFPPVEIEKLVNKIVSFGKQEE